MVAMLSLCEGEWVWSTCTIRVSTSGDSNCVIRAVGELGWRVEVKYMVENGGLLAQEMTAVCQPLQQVPEVTPDENMATIHKLLQNLNDMSLDGQKLQLSSNVDDQVICFERC
eukprot:GFUD01022112.1.p2 GENE.GFUD01022112.1~~GFUD01022112.1.p2  ORF type:complete len:113 (-),score=34.26 GFUD01022112.1:527-865(-)